MIKEHLLDKVKEQEFLVNFKGDIEEDMLNVVGDELTGKGLKEYQLEGPDFRTAKAKREENEAVARFQKTKDMAILEKVYLNRLPTLKYWARKNRHMDNNNHEDILGELTRVFVRTVYKYQSERTVKGKKSKAKTHFNTYLFYALENSMCNFYNRKRAKKRCPKEFEESPEQNFLLSLDFSYGEGDSEFTLKDIIPDSNESENSVEDAIALRETIAILCPEEEPRFVKDFMVRLSEGNSIASALREQRSKKGRVRLDGSDANRFSKRKCNRIVKELIANRHGHKIQGDFTLIDYEINGKFLSYEIEMKKSEECDLLMKKIRSIRKHKEYYLKKFSVV